LSIDNFETEENGTFSTADVVPLDTEFKGRLASREDIDVFKLTAPSSGTVTVKFDSPISSSYSTYFQLALYDSSGVLHSYKDIGSDQTVVYEGLAKGNYYYTVQRSGYNYNGEQYSFIPSFTAGSIDNFETEENGTFSTADVVPLDTEFKGRLASREDIDVF
jgi:hypothetical protein